MHLDPILLASLRGAICEKNAFLEDDSFRSILHSYLLLRGSRLQGLLNIQSSERPSFEIPKTSPSAADVVCNKAEECKQEIDMFLALLQGVPKDMWNTFAALLRNVTVFPSVKSYDDETARKQRRAKINATNYDRSEIVSVKGNATKAEEVIKSLRFSHYEENSLCGLKEGIPGNEFDATVEEIAELTNMPVKLKKVIKRARNFTRGDVLAVNRLQFKTRNENMVFGRIAVLRNGDTLDMTYSIHSVEYKLKKKQRKPENAGTFTKFSEALNMEYDEDNDDEGGEDDHEDFHEISVDLRQDFLAFFHKQAIEGFVKHCDYLLKILDYEQKEEPQILQRIVVKNGQNSEGVKEEGAE